MGKLIKTALAVLGIVYVLEKFFQIPLKQIIHWASEKML